jgi:hypothetical protein
MSTRLKATVLVAAFQIHALSVSAQGVIANDAAILQIGGYPSLTLTNSVNPSEGRFGLFAIIIVSPGESQFTFSYWGIAEEYALYATTPGVVIDPAFADATTPLVSNNGLDPGSSDQWFDAGESRYFAYWDDRPLYGNGIPDVNDNYGWVLLTYNGFGFQVSSSATAIGGGIITGTLTQVPEPSVNALALLGISLLASLKQAFFCRTTPCS